MHCSGWSSRFQALCPADEERKQRQRKFKTVFLCSEDFLSNVLYVYSGIVWLQIVFAGYQIELN